MNYINIYSIIIGASILASCSADDAAEPETIEENLIEYDSFERLPKIRTLEVLDIGFKSIEILSTIEDDGGLLIQERGISWSINPEMDSSDNKVKAGKGAGDFITVVDSLRPDSTYYLRTYCLNSKGYFYGSIFKVNTIENYVRDADNNEYEVIKVANRFWLKENLKTTRFNNGDKILELDSSNILQNFEEPTMVAPNFEKPLVQDFGYLYNRYTVSDMRQACPEGYHPSTTSDWEDLRTILYDKGYSFGSAGPLIENDTSYWEYLFRGNNLTGFSARGAGYSYRSPIYFFREFKENAYWWAANDEFQDDNIGYNFLHGSSARLLLNSFTTNDNLSIRCVRDENK